MTDPISSAVQEVLDLFANELAPLQFGDLEADVLASAAEEVRTVAGAAERAEEALDAARATLAEKQDALLQKAQQALAYARVYAESRPALASRIEQIALPRSSRRTSKVEPAKMESESLILSAPPARRGRPRKLVPVDDLVDLEAGPALAGASIGS